VIAPPAREDVQKACHAAADPFLFQMTCIREHSSGRWRREEATATARTLVAADVAA
jgi:hypothetical protein